MVGNTAPVAGVEQVVLRRLLPLLLLAALLATAEPAAARPRPWTSVTVKFATPDGWFKATITDPESMARIRNATSSRVGIPNGRLVRGTAENRGHDWHLEDVELVDLSIEVCDGTSRMVDEELDRWIAEVGRFCPWDARMLWYTARAG